MKPLKITRTAVRTMRSAADENVHITVAVEHARGEARAEEWCLKLCSALEAYDPAVDLLKEVLHWLEAGAASPLPPNLAGRIREVLQQGGAE